MAAIHFSKHAINDGALEDATKHKPSTKGNECTFRDRGTRAEQ